MSEEITVPEVAEARIWTSDQEMRRLRVRRMFSDIANTYDLLNGLMSFRLHRKWRAIAANYLQLKRGDRVADLCCGTGDFLPYLRERVGNEGQVIGLDFAEPMLNRAKAKHSTSADYILSDALQLPIASDLLQGVSVGWGIRNVCDIDKVHAEIFRILAHQGRFVSIDMAKPRSKVARALSSAVFHTVVPMLGSLFGQFHAYKYLPESTDHFYNRQQLMASMSKAGFSQIGFRDLMFGNVCIHWGFKP